MFAEATKDLLGKIAEATEQARVTLGTPTHLDDANATARLTLVDILPSTQRRDTSGQRSHVRLRYMVTATGEPLGAQSILSDIAQALFTQDDLEVAFYSQEPGFWQAFGVPPQPAIYVSINVPLTAPAKMAPLVTEPAAVRLAPLLSLTGRVVGPTGKGLSGARLSIGGLNATVRTDAIGQFQLDGIPHSTKPLRLCIRSGSSLMHVSAMPGSKHLEITYAPEEV